MRSLSLAIGLQLLASSLTVSAHGGGHGGEDGEAVDMSGMTYAERHMATEHHIDSCVRELLPVGAA